MTSPHDHAPLPFHQLQQKILPELHLIAAQSDIAHYRKFNQQALILAIMERQANRDGQVLARGILDISADGYGFLHSDLLDPASRSVLVTAGVIKQFHLRTGDDVIGRARKPHENERYGSLIQVEAVNGIDPEAAHRRPRFDGLTPTFPDVQLVLEEPGMDDDLSLRVVDLLVPIGRGQRALIVAPPKAGKTTLLKKIANSITRNYPDVTVMVLLVDERPEEVTDFRESVQGAQVIASTFDESPERHLRVAEFVHERALRIVEEGGHVVILLDSITRLARANNLVTPSTGRTLSGGLDSNALHWPKKFLGAARNIRGGGSLTILATALVETGSRMDDVIFEEFKGTGNAELVLSRRLEERRIFPSIDILKSGTRREELLLQPEVLKKMWLMRKVISDLDPTDAMEMLLGRIGKTRNNVEFLNAIVTA
ncbi:transcription termination factor Rho [Deinococcus sp. QL22]|uniref:transcription termination factor Rho n=1 Tax=Deinococcus sp. QL22 TaxID=2939437 RepID=UPI0020181433|nr:transcription termination factor Rho [Deinococcus sp. QL22]UQN09011.1 transcription termination factor Rho [Deinococcus sp. QL22]